MNALSMVKELAKKIRDAWIERNISEAWDMVDSAYANLGRMGAVAVPKVLERLEKAENGGTNGTVVNLILKEIGEPALPHVLDYLESNAPLLPKIWLLEANGNLMLGWKTSPVYDRAMGIIAGFARLGGLAMGRPSDVRAMRLTAIEILGKSGDARTAPTLAPALYENDQKIFNAASKGLMRAGAQGVVVLEAALREPALVAKRREITEALGNARKKAPEQGQRSQLPGVGIEDLGLKQSLVRRNRPLGTVGAPRLPAKAQISLVGA